MTDLAYSQKVIELMKSPKNMGEIKNADGVATVGNQICGDVMRLYVKIAKRKTHLSSTARPRRRAGGEAGESRRGRENAKRDEEYIADIKFQTLGCAAAIATSSILTEMAKGKTLKEAEKLTNQEIISQLGGLPQIKLHCSVLATKALKKAIEDYRQKKE